MSSRVAPTFVEPTLVTVPAIRTIVYSISRSTTTLESVQSTATTSAMTTLATNSPAPVPTVTGIPPLPTEFDTPVSTGSKPSPTIAVTALVAVVLCGLILLFALLYFIILRFRGRCQNCSGLVGEIRKWKNGELRVITPGTVQQRMRAWDLEKGAIDLQAKMHRDRMRMQSLAHLERQIPTAQSSINTLPSQDTIDACKEEQDIVKDLQAETKPQTSIPAHVVAAVARLDQDSESTLVNDEFPKTYSMYLEQIIGPRQAAAKRLLYEASDEADQRAIHQHLDMKENHLPAPRKDGDSRFQEHFSWATDHRV